MVLMNLLLNLRKVIVFFLFEKGCMKKIFNLLINNKHGKQQKDFQE